MSSLVDRLSDPIIWIPGVIFMILPTLLPRLWRLGVKLFSNSKKSLVDRIVSREIAAIEEFEKLEPFQKVLVGQSFQIRIIERAVFIILNGLAVYSICLVLVINDGKPAVALFVLLFAGFGMFEDIMRVARLHMRFNVLVNPSQKAFFA